jgi:tetratricopeptide (TPR) repeat protein
MMDKIKIHLNQFGERLNNQPNEEIIEETARSGEDESPLLEESGKKPKGKIFSKLAYLVLLASIFVLPLAFVPSQSVHFIFTKQLIFVTAVLFALAVWVLSELKNGNYELPVSPIVAALGAVAVVTLLSALFSGSIGQSFFGNGFEVGTAVSILAGFLAVFIVPLYFTNKDKIFSGYLMLFAAFAVLALYEIARLILGPAFLSFGIFTDITSNLVGKWNELGVFFGFTTILALTTIEFFPRGKLIKILSFVTLIVSLGFLALVNLSAIWLTLGLFSVVLFVYLFSFARGEKVETEGEFEKIEESEKTPRRQFPTATLIVVLVSILFIVSGGYIGNFLSSKFKISQIEVRPSWQSTSSVAKNTLKVHPLLGAGPNQFTGEWLKYKDPTVNSTMFWNSDFNYGVGLIPTYVVNTGLLGMVAWLVFFVFFLYAGFRAIFLPSNDRVLRYLTISSFLGSFFLWIFNIFYVPGNVIVALTFIFTGLFVSALVKEGLAKVKGGLYTGSAKLVFVSVLGLIFLLAASISIEYGLVERYVSYFYYQNGLITLNTTGNIDQAESKLLQAAAISKNDVIYRALTEIGIIRMSNLLGAATKDTPAETLRTQFQSILGTTLSYASEAVNINSADYQNWIERGRVYEAVVPLKIDGAYEAAAGAYQEALKYAPSNPSINLMLARLEYTKGDNNKAKDFITKALNQKQNYTDAIFLLAQIQIKQGDVNEAIKSVGAASVLSPNDPTIFFQLGLLQFDNKDYKEAAASLEQAVALSPQYANAKYYLGLSYDKLGMDKEAIAQFTDLKQTNPDNQEVDLILKNLKAGKSPFTNATPPVNTPDKRTSPPLTEKGAAKSKTPASSE